MGEPNDASTTPRILTPAVQNNPPVKPPFPNNPKIEKDSIMKSENDAHEGAGNTGQDGGGSVHLAALNNSTGFPFHRNGTELNLDLAIENYGNSLTMEGASSRGVWSAMELLLFLHTLPIMYWIYTLFKSRGIKDVETLKRSDIKNLRQLKRLVR
ncbi:hypothetical protein BJ741DRAFT_645979 [Chytriomyces cf. hyalinus JEL632]|nr:hypothetical protein BJ741DRAFT_645979 [Chytriomyces cf. hyalinus JEL632]